MISDKGYIATVWPVGVYVPEEEIDIKMLA